MNFSKLGFAAVTAAFLSGCVVVEDGGYRPPPPRPNNPQMCPMIYAPVCGERRGMTRTIGNSCQARADGYRILYNGQCRRPGSSNRPDWSTGPGSPNRPGPGRPPRPDGERACTREFAPVCGVRGRSERTFSNACEAGNSGYRIVSNRPC